MDIGGQQQQRQQKEQQQRGEHDEEGNGEEEEQMEETGGGNDGNDDDEEMDESDGENGGDSGTDTALLSNLEQRVKALEDMVEQKLDKIEKKIDRLLDLATAKHLMKSIGVQVGAGDLKKKPLSRDEKLTIGRHEAFHATIMWLSGVLKPIEMSIGPDGQGETRRRETDNISESKELCIARIELAYAGPVGEAIVSHNLHSAESDADITTATQIMNSMITEKGFYPELGLQNFKGNISERTQRRIDRLRRKELAKIEENVRQTLMLNRDLVERLANYFVDNGCHLDEAEISTFFDGNQPRPFSGSNAAAAPATVDPFTVQSTSGTAAPTVDPSTVQSTSGTAAQSDSYMGGLKLDDSYMEDK